MNQDDNVEDGLSEEETEALEERWNKAAKACEKEMEKAYALAEKAKQLAISISEKYGVSIDWDVGGYVPESISQWTDKEKFSEAEVEFYKEFISENGYAGGEDDEPGDFWYPSRFC